jgi:hypothetical protein
LPSLDSDIPMGTCGGRACLRLAPPLRAPLATTQPVPLPSLRGPFGLRRP